MNYPAPNKISDTIKSITSPQYSYVPENIHVPIIAGPPAIHNKNSSFAGDFSTEPEKAASQIIFVILCAVTAVFIVVVFFKYIGRKFHK